MRTWWDDQSFPSLLNQQADSGWNMKELSCLHADPGSDPGSEQKQDYIKWVRLKKTEHPEPVLSEVSWRKVSDIQSLWTLCSSEILEKSSGWKHTAGHHLCNIGRNWVFSSSVCVCVCVCGLQLNRWTHTLKFTAFTKLHLNIYQPEGGNFPPTVWTQRTHTNSCLPCIQTATHTPPTQHDWLKPRSTKQLHFHIKTTSLWPAVTHRQRDAHMETHTHTQINSVFKVFW